MLTVFLWERRLLAPDLNLLRAVRRNESDLRITREKGYYHVLYVL
jgi:hypothetical protein